MHSSQIPETFYFAKLCSFLKRLKINKNKEILMNFLLQGLQSYSETLKSIHEVVLDIIILKYSFFSFELTMGSSNPSCILRNIEDWNSEAQNHSMVS
jgi:hypothetical protein